MQEKSGRKETFNANFTYFRNVLYLDIQKTVLLAYNYIYFHIYIRKLAFHEYSSVISTH